MRLLAFPLLVILAALASSAAAEDENTLMAVRTSGGLIPYQGPCSRTVDRHTGTAACYGGSQGMINIEYQDNSRVCVYVDHADSAAADFFIPLRTYKEWTSFRDQVAGGQLPALSLVWGCPAQKIQDDCHSYHDMPDSRAGDVGEIISSANYRATYVCVAQDACGSWQLATSSGSCPKDDGVCGTAQDHTTHNPPTVNLCGWGTPSPVSLSGQFFVWTCAGTNGGKTASCQARHGGLIDCGPLDRGSFSDLNMFSSGLCVPGSSVSDFIRIGDIWYWFCNSGSGASFAFASCLATAIPANSP